jgi:hypothetical protein
MADKPIELKNVDSMPGSINQLISTNKRLKRPPSLSESFAFTPENIERANQIPLISSSERLNILQEEVASPLSPLTNEVEPVITTHWKYEKQIVEVSIKLLFHITLISIFETLFYFLYVSSLENDGIETTVNTFINGAANGCQNMSAIQIQIIDDLLEPYINSTNVIQDGNLQESLRLVYDKTISNRAWGYVGGVIGLFLLATIYTKIRKIEIRWKVVILENSAMVILLALYELMFFNTIIYPYHPISTAEIARNAIEKLQNQCGILVS